jgi:class 3 adenylate cyclase
VFCDVTGSTELGEQLDPESHAQGHGPYFDAMRARSNATEAPSRSSSGTP